MKMFSFNQGTGIKFHHACYPWVDWSYEIQSDMVQHVSYNY